MRERNTKNVKNVKNTKNTKNTTELHIDTGLTKEITRR